MANEGEGPPEGLASIGPKGMKNWRAALWLAGLGGLSFWLPDVTVHISQGRNFDSLHVRLITVLMPSMLLAAYLAGRRVATRRNFKWPGAAMLVGVWFSGGLFMTLAATASGGGLAGTDGIRGGMLVFAMSLLPPYTFIMATYDGSLGALLIVTIGALVFWSAQLGAMTIRRRLG